MFAEEEMKDLIFKISFFITLLVAIFVFSGNIENKSFIYKNKRFPERLVIETVDKKKIIKLIKEGALSGKEALFYQKIPTSSK